MVKVGAVLFITMKLKMLHFGSIFNVFFLILAANSNVTHTYFNI
ncbi:hypothetical protein PTUN_a0370 [Pseudoalteromonas tunicata]|nr:hypothetical protein PTUN_a0370 [Pseudoalteromonas tunicata]